MVQQRNQVYRIRISTAKYSLIPLEIVFVTHICGHAFCFLFSKFLLIYFQKYGGLTKHTFLRKIGADTIKSEQ